MSFPPLFFPSIGVFFSFFFLFVRPAFLFQEGGGRDGRSQKRPRKRPLLTPLPLFLPQTKQKQRHPLNYLQNNKKHNHKKNTKKPVKTHRELFSDFYSSLFGAPLADLLASSPAPTHAPVLYRRMMRDILSAGGLVRDDLSSPEGGRAGDSLKAASYALGYNLAIEYLADYEKTWMLDSFRALVDERGGGALARAGVKKEQVDWVFLEVHAEGEAEHAAIGHSAVLALVPEADTPLLRRAMADHDRDFAVFYNAMADLLIEKSQ